MRYLFLSLLVLLPAGFAHAQGRRGGDPWQRIKEYDANEDGKVSKEEFSGPERFFTRLDLDKDGFVTQEETKKFMEFRKATAGGMNNGRGRRGSRGADQMAKAMDSNGDGSVSKAEWDAFFKKADENGDGILQNEELRAALGGNRMVDNAPKVGAAAPKVKAALAKDGRKIDLASPQRTTVLIFGSWT